MRTSLIETKELEDWILEKGDPSEHMITEAKVILSPELAEKSEWQIRTYALVKLYGRKKLRDDIQLVEKMLFTSPKHKLFQNRIFSIFK